MQKLIEMLLENLSTRDVFLFRIACGACGTECGGSQVRFSKAGVNPQSREKKVIYDAIYEQEFQTARRTAVRNAAEQLNYCPICKRLVCNRCFLICEDLDMCAECAANLKESGRPVEADTVESAI